MVWIQGFNKIIDCEGVLYQIGFLPFILIMLLLIIFNILILLISFRENISELNNSLENINNIDVLSDLNNR